MTNEQITSRCQNCGGLKKEHGTRKPWKCSTRLADINWKPWTVAEYNEATAVHRERLSGPKVQQPQDVGDTACGHCGSRNNEFLEGSTWECYDCGKTFEPGAAQEPAPVIVEMPRRETPRTIDCTPNFGMLFTQFARDAEQAGGLLAATICAAQFDVYPETAEALERRVGVLRAVQGFVAPATIALQAATTVTDIEKLRDVMAGVLAKLNQQANEFEAMASDLAPQEEN